MQRTWWLEAGTIIVTGPYCGAIRRQCESQCFSFESMMTSSSGNMCRVTGHLCGESPVTGEFPEQRAVTRSFGVFFDLHPNKRLSKRSWGGWFETPLCPLGRHCNGVVPPSKSPTQNQTINTILQGDVLFALNSVYYNRKQCVKLSINWITI